VSAERLACAQQDQRGVRQPPVDHQLRVGEQPIERAIENALAGRLSFPQPAQHRDGFGVEVADLHLRARLGGEVWAGFLVDAAELLVGHRHERVARPHPERALVLPGASAQARRRVDDQDSLAIVVVLLDRDPLVQLLVESRLGAPRLGKRRGAHHAPRAAVLDPEHDRAAAFVRESDDVLDQILEMEAASRRLELEPCARGRLQQCGELVLCGHEGSPARANSSPRS